MQQWWKKYPRQAFLLFLTSATVAVLLASAGQSRYVHADLFGVAPLASGIVGALLFPAALQRLAWGGIAPVYWVSTYKIFVDYHNRPWFAEPPPGGCGGLCFGWYSFEFDPPYYAVVVAGLLGVIVGIALQHLMLLVDRRRIRYTR